ncbi:MAG: ligand-binding SRPBCC domain-containing protein [Bacteroidia bacterium]|jgi:ligand-binding SRPBCC domain-containing protein
MKLHFRKHQQFLPIPLEVAWGFFSSPHNLNEITPADMQFEIITREIPRMYAGQIIQYNVTPFPFLKISWVTEITRVENMKMFVDEQRFGPYSFWHHQHIFEQRDGGVLMTDIIHYKVPFGIVGKLANILVVKRKVNAIFEYRTKVLQNKFGKSTLLEKEVNG